MNPRFLIVLALLLGGAGYFALRSGPSDAATDALDPSARDATIAGTDPTAADLSGDDLASDGVGETRSVAPTNMDGVDADLGAGAEVRTFEGRVLDPLGNGVAGARVELIVEGERGVLSLNVFGTNDDTLVAETDSIGGFSFPATATGTTSKVRVLARGFRILETQTESEDLGNLTLERGAILTGVVLSAEGGPVRGANVTRRGSQGTAGMFSVTLDAALGAPSGTRSGNVREGSTVTAADGSFDLPHEPAGAYRLTARHDEHPRAVVNGEVAEGATSQVRVQFEPAGVLEGVLLGFAPDDRSTLRVRTRRVQEAGSGTGEAPRILGFDNPEQTTTPGADGSFALKGLVVGASYEVWATEELGGFWESDTCSEVLSASVPSSGLALHFVQGGRLQFQVVDAKTLESVTSMHIKDEWESGGTPTLDFGNAAAPKDYPGGHVTLESLRPPGGSNSLQLHIRAPGYRTYETTVSVGELADLDLGVIHLTPTARIVFTVKDSDGKPVADAKVSLFDNTSSGMSIVDGSDGEDEPEGGVFISARVSFESEDGEQGGLVTTMGGSSLLAKGRTDATGQCVIELPDENAVRLKVFKEGFAPYEVEDFPLPRAGEHEEEVVLSRGGRATVTVYDARGSVVPKVRIEHHESGDTHTTDAAGEVHLEFLPPGLHHFRLQPKTASQSGIFVVNDGPSEDPDLTAWTEVLVQEDGVVQVALTQAPQALLRGRITQRGKALKRANLLLIARDDQADPAQFAGTELETGTAKDKTSLTGAFEFRPVDAGAYTLVIRHPDRQMAERLEVVLREGERTWDLDLGLTSVRGQVRNEAGDPIAGAQVSAHVIDPDGAPGTFRVVGHLGGMSDSGVTTDADGQYELAGVASGTPISIHARVEGLAPARSGPIELAADQERSAVDLVLEVGATLVVEYEESAETMRFLSATHSDGTTQMEQATGTSVTLDGLQSGDWTLQLYGLNGDDPIEEQVTVAKGIESTVVLDGASD
tara:strand:- start:4589 stop:7561 length:2973 start_codon:yes stop_codon:yes gene_type:complete